MRVNHSQIIGSIMLEAVKCQRCPQTALLSQSIEAHYLAAP